MKKEINLIELQKTTMINLEETDYQKIKDQIESLVEQSKVFDFLNLVEIQPLENIADAYFNFLREDEVNEQKTNPKEVLALHNKVNNDFGVLKNEK